MSGAAGFLLLSVPRAVATGFFAAGKKNPVATALGTDPEKSRRNIKCCGGFFNKQ